MTLPKAYVETTIPSFYFSELQSAASISRREWTNRHIANANKFEHIRRVNGLLGLATPDLVTPLELLGGNDVD